MSSNLLKQYYVSVDYEKTRVIDSNELARQKIKELNKKMQDSINEDGFEEFKDGFTEGIESVRVAELLNDGEECGENNNVIKTSPAYEGPDEEEIQKMIESRLQEAEKKAQEIVNSAMQEAEAIRQKAEMQGKQAGYEEGSLKAKNELKQMEEELAGKQRLLEEKYEGEIARLEPVFVDAITEVYEEIFHTDLSSYHDILMYVVGNVIQKSDEDKQFLIHISKKDYEFLFSKKTELLSQISRENIKLELVEDVTVADRQCIIETENGVFDCGIDTQLAELKKRLKLLAYQR